MRDRPIASIHTINLRSDMDKVFLAKLLIGLAIGSPVSGS